MIIFHYRLSQSKPIYFTSEEPDSLHADRSPYDYEPAEAKDSPGNPEVEFFHSGLPNAQNLIKKWIIKKRNL
jgi:hypothetical protein